jgi:hypothetical protein
MSEGGHGLAGGWRGRLLALIGVTALALAISLAASAARAGAAVPEKTDIMFVFDTSGSMEGVLNEAKEEIKTLVANTRASLPNVEFGVANVEDLPGYFEGVLVETKSEKEYEEDPEKPWGLWQPLTAEETKVEEAINKLSLFSPEGGPAHGGGDAPEAYGRALYETATNPKVGWRAGARHEIVLIGDQVPHAPDLNEGIPSEFQFTEPGNDGFNAWPDTGEELGGKWGIPETQWKEGESLEFHKTLQRLAAEEKPLAMVDYFHTYTSEKDNYIHYWEYWAAEAGGQAVTVDEGSKSLDAKLEEIIKESSEGVPPCPPGTERTPTTPCVKKKPPVPTPAPVKPAPPTSPPVPTVVTVDEEDGEILDEYEFPESGEAELTGEVDEGAEAARFQGFQGLQAGPLTAQLGQPAAFAAGKKGRGRGKGKGKSKKCQKGYVKKGKKCVNNAPIPYGLAKLTIPSAGKYKLALKPSAETLAALRKGKRLNVKLALKFTPAGTTTPILSTKFVTVHLKPKKHKQHKHRKK